jgi:PAS domain S-box-containing protein
MDKRQRFIAALFKSMFSGNFSGPPPIAESLDNKDADEIDAMMFGLYILAAQLNETTISSDKFYGIFNTVSDMIFVLSNVGIIEEVNQSACDHLGYSRADLIGQPLDFLTGNVKPSFFRHIKKLADPAGTPSIGHSQFYTRKGTVISLEATVKYMWTKPERKKGVILLTAKDISFRIAEENRLLRAIIESQEKDRIRMSRDYHDSIIQQIAGMHFFFSSVAPGEVDPNIKARYDKYIKHLDKIISDIRGICFDLMPVTLQDSGLVDAVYELCYETLKPRNIKYIISSSDSFPVVDAAMRIDLYRVIQEFLNNSIRHAQATRISMKFITVGDLVCIDLRDNGLGFEISGRGKKGMGIQNMLSRIKSHDGKLSMYSAPSKGTHFNIKVPLKVTQ